MVAALSIRGVSKRFPGVQALDSVDIEIEPGEIHALCGENGAGKSTLMKILSGRIAPDSGEIFYFGGKYTPSSPRDARDMGLILVHQEISLVPDMTVAENIFLGNLPTNRFGLVDNRKMQSAAVKVLQNGALSVRPRAKARSLSIAQQQMVEIVRTAAYPYRVAIFDEPTAALAGAEAEAVFSLVRRLRENNTAIIYISHKMSEIFSLSDRITVLRDGKTRGTLKTKETNEDEVLNLMIGRSIERGHSGDRQVGFEEILKVSDISVPGYVKGVNFSVRKGEILGLYGLVGAGRSELVEAIFGIRPATGRIFWEGKPATIRSPRDAVALGIGLVPEDRKLQGLVLSHGVRVNMILPSLRSLSRLGLLSSDKIERLFEEYVQRLLIKVSSPRTAAGTLSGGNQQKVVLAKWLAIKPKLLILDEPTRGIDVGAKAEIHAIIRDLASRGISIILVSSEMSEIIKLSDRVLTMRCCVLAGEHQGDAINEDAILRSAMVAEPARSVVNG